MISRWHRSVLICAIFLELIVVFFFQTRKAHADCLSFLPHGYNGYFVHLPKNEEFCVDTPNGAVFYKTNQFGARVIKGVSSEVPVHAFGESQLIEIFPRHGKTGHVLWKVYGKRDLYLHGAPNNGPNETLSFIDYIQRNKIPAPKNITIGVNLGFDLFRIIPGWRTTEKVAHEAKDIPFMMKHPTLYGVVNFGKAITGNKFEFIDRPKQIERARQHFDKKTDDINIYFTEWLKNLRKLKNKYNLEIDVIFFDAYWSYDLDKKANFVSSNLEYNKKLKLIVCSNKQHYSIFKKTLFLQYSKKAKTDNLFTYTLRHFKKHPNQFHNITEFCAES